MRSVNDGFFNPGGVYDNFDELLNHLKGKKIIKIHLFKKG